jgi:hypothetical protein
MPTTSSLRSAESCSHHESAGGGGGGCRCLPFDGGLPCDKSPFFGGMVLPAGFVFFWGGVDGFRRGISIANLRLDILLYARLYVCLFTCCHFQKDYSTTVSTEMKHTQINYGFAKKQLIFEQAIRYNCIAQYLC